MEVLQLSVSKRRLNSSNNNNSSNRSAKLTGDATSTAASAIGGAQTISTAEGELGQETSI
jgi:hypothetical protein